jgi:hypothetical protein
MIAVQYTKFKKILPKETREKYSNYFSDFLRLLVLPVERFVIVEFEEGGSTQPRDHFFMFGNTNGAVLSVQKSVQKSK